MMRFSAIDWNFFGSRLVRLAVPVRAEHPDGQRADERADTLLEPGLPLGLEPKRAARPPAAVPHRPPPGRALRRQRLSVSRQRTGNH